MATQLISHPASLAHDTGPGHPEWADRIRAIEKALSAPGFQTLIRKEAPRAALAWVTRVHPGQYIEAVEASIPAEGLAYLDADTVVSPGSFEAAMRAAGGAVFAVDAVMTGEAENSFVAMRPPGHHAEQARAMGFCLFNNAAIAARHAQARHDAERVAIMDFDVHHGNGTQAIFWSDPTVLYCSTHQTPLFPGTGARREQGEFNTIVNAPLSAGSDGAVFKEAMNTVILPRIKAFAPDLIVISAGFDAHQRDPLANLNFTAADFAWVTGKLIDTALRHSNGRVVSVLEGGYDLEALGLSAAAHVLTLMGRTLTTNDHVSPSTGS